MYQLIKNIREEQLTQPDRRVGGRLPKVAAVWMIWLAKTGWLCTLQVATWVNNNSLCKLAAYGLLQVSSCSRQHEIFSSSSHWCWWVLSWMANGGHGDNHDGAAERWKWKCDAALLVCFLSKWGWCLLWRRKCKTEWILLPCLENGATSWRSFILSMVLLHLFLPFNGAAPPEIFLSLVRLHIFTLQNCARSSGDHFLNGATTLFLAFQWCGFFENPHFNGVVAPFHFPEWCPFLGRSSS